MIQNLEHNQSTRHLEHTLGEMLDALDELHTAASEGELNQVTRLNKRELLAWLREFVYTAQETIDEIGGGEMWSEPVMLRIVEKPDESRRGA